MTGVDRRAKRRGQPAIVLAMILGGWMLVRGAILELPLVPRAAGLSLVAGTAPEKASPPVSATQPALAQGLVSTPVTPLFAARARPVPSPVEVGPAPAFASSPMDVAAGTELLWLAGAALAPLPRIVAETLQPPAQFARMTTERRGSRWSGDGWLVLREGTGGLGQGGGAAPIYGASQVGAVVRYRLDPDNVHALALYLRGAAALAGSRQQEAGVGLAVRPSARIPVEAQVEARVTRDARRLHVRPAALLVSNLPPGDLPADFRAEGYVQAGYVGGDFASAFVDGQVRVERPIAHICKAVVTAGGGVWGGAQRDAARLDAGPTAAISSGRLRAVADWRFRLTGNAVPKSGPAVTLSAGF